jgi:phenylpropionate dioxygenase-like ring-hydroxylating dioxygenase large terminal subunit
MITNKLQRVHRVNRPLEVGETLLVPHVVRFERQPLIGSGGHGWFNVWQVPVMWPPHTDEHDGQVERHFHVDSRFTNDQAGRVVCLVEKDATQQLHWIGARVLRSQPSEQQRTPVVLIGKAIHRMPCKALRNGKCPHKGFNMAQVQPDAHGVLTCPMHGMRFWNATGKGIPYLPGQQEGDAPNTNVDEDRLWRQG